MLLCVTAMKNGVQFIWYGKSTYRKLSLSGHGGTIKKKKSLWTVYSEATRPQCAY